MIDHLDHALLVSELLLAGATRHEIERRRLRQFWGIAAARDDLSTAVRCAEFLPRLPSNGFYSHSTAALLWDLPLPGRFERETDIHVSVPPGSRAPDAGQIVGHQATVCEDEVALVDGIPVSSPARSWREMSNYLGVHDLIALGDAILFHENPRASLSELYLEVGRDRFPGKSTARAALPFLSDRAESRPESLLRMAIVFAGLPLPNVNQAIYAPTGRWIARVDLSFDGFPIVVEYDGDQHRTDPRQWRRDVDRFGDLDDAGLTVIRATSDDLPYFSRTVVRTRNALVRHGWQPPI